MRLMSATATEEDALRGLRGKLMYRSKQRGFLELDLLVGLWAERELPRMEPRMLHAFSDVLDLENPDLFKWLTGQLVPPEEVASNPAYSALRLHVQQTLGQNSQEAAKAAPGAEWVRGWDDAWKGKGAGTTPAAGAGAQGAAAGTKS
ncbi:hypothetical protein FOA52_008257 [Chlamydomonas sp. UWO 241]|nr:hypothetical protein FOA52_008257 [Chlamydomonas sp. UWO 241]